MIRMGLLVLTTTLCLTAKTYAAPAPGAAIPPTPGTIAITDEGPQGFTVRHFPTRLHLYTHDGDSPTVSRCVEGCASAWPPVRADSADAKPIGDWTLVPRADGPPQWAYQGRPVYVRYHDAPDAPSGDGQDGMHLVANIPPVRGN